MKNEQLCGKHTVFGRESLDLGCFLLFWDKIEQF